MQGSTRRGEWLAVAFWAALGTAIAVAAWRMDRLAHLNIEAWSAPGLLPGVIGVGMVVLAAMLALRLRQQGASAEPASPARGDSDPGTSADPGASGGHSAGGHDTDGHVGASALAALLCLVFAGLALGRGWPFQLEAAAFIFVFTVTFGAAAWRAEGRLARGVAVALAVAVVAAFGIGALFEQVFLVRLP